MCFSFGLLLVLFLSGFIRFCRMSNIKSIKAQKVYILQQILHNTLNKF